jgi:hypothetical protein
MHLALSLHFFGGGGVLQMHMAKLITQAKQEVLAAQTGVY